MSFLLTYMIIFLVLIDVKFQLTLKQYLIYQEWFTFLVKYLKNSVNTIIRFYSIFFPRRLERADQSFHDKIILTNFHIRQRSNLRE